LWKDNKTVESAGVNLVDQR